RRSCECKLVQRSGYGWRRAPITTQDRPGCFRANSGTVLLEPYVLSGRSLEPSSDSGQHELPAAHLERGRIGGSVAHRECTFPNLLRLQLVAPQLDHPRWGAAV